MAKGSVAVAKGSVTVAKGSAAMDWAEAEGSAGCSFPAPSSSCSQRRRRPKCPPMRTR